MSMTKQPFIIRTKKILHKIKQHKKPYRISILAKEFIIQPGVFSPQYFSDTEFFADVVINMIKDGLEFLEIGPGCGVISVLAVMKGARRVVAIDISQRAVENTRENATLHNVSDKITILRGDVFSPLLSSDDKFDIIFWNPPFGWVKNKPKNTLERTVFDSGYQLIKKYVCGGHNFLKPSGRLLLGFSTTIGQISELKKIVRKCNSKLRLLNKIKSEQASHPVKFQLYEILKK